MSEPIERVTRAIFDSVEYDETTDISRLEFTSAARAAIAAMRDPTPEMIAAAWRTLNPCGEKRGLASYGRRGVKMSEMVERVAEAIAAMDHDIASSDQTWQRTLARAAIAAMREPTGEMIDAGADDGQPSGIWRAMVDEALK